MKKVLVLAAFAALLPASSQAYWGFDFTGGKWEMDDAFVKAKASEYDSSSIDQGKYNFTGSIFFEGNSSFKLGLMLGAGMTSKIEMSAASTGNTLTAKNTTIDAPASLYLKWRPGNGHFSIFAGGGVDYLRATTKYHQVEGSSSESGEFTASKVVPHVMGGAEIFLFKWFSVGASAKYILSDAIVEDFEEDGEIVRNGPAYDYSGLRANAFARIYFGGPSKEEKK